MQVPTQENLKKESKMNSNSKVGSVLLECQMAHIRVLARWHSGDIKTHPFRFFSDKDTSRFVF